MEENKSLVVTNDGNEIQVVDSKQYIVANIGIEHYGIDIGYIDNIVRMQKITRVPKAQNYFKGVINLRGEIIPVMSVRTRFGLEDDEITDKTRIIILKPEGQEAIGIIVDAVKEVITLDENHIERKQFDVKDENSKFINGIGKNQGGLISLLNVNGVIEES